MNCDVGTYYIQNKVPIYKSFLNEINIYIYIHK